MSRRWIITVLGRDCPGIVAGVTKVLYGLGCNLEDSAMTRLEGEFTIMLIFSGPPKITEERVRNAFEPLARRLRLVVHLKRLSKIETSAPRAPGRTGLISVYGADRPGIVYRVSEALARERINIVDVHTHRSAGKAPFLYLMLLEAELPFGRSLESLEPRLKKLGKALGIEVSLRPAEADVL